MRCHLKFRTFWNDRLKPESWILSNFRLRILQVVSTLINGVFKKPFFLRLFHSIYCTKYLERLPFGSLMVRGTVPEKRCRLKAKPPLQVVSSLHDALRPFNLYQRTELEFVILRLCEHKTVKIRAECKGRLHTRQEGWLIMPHGRRTFTTSCYHIPSCRKVCIRPLISSLMH